MNGCGNVNWWSVNVRCGDTGEQGGWLCPSCASEMEARVLELEAWKADTEESFRITLEDRGAHDEMHCSCVPVLRAEIAHLREQMATTLIYDLWDERAALQAENERLRAALEAVEWFAFGPFRGQQPCPWCRADYYEGHAPDCQRQRAIRGEG